MPLPTDRCCAPYVCGLPPLFRCGLPTTFTKSHGSSVCLPSASSSSSSSSSRTAPLASAFLLPEPSAHGTAALASWSCGRTNQLPFQAHLQFLLRVKGLPAWKFEPPGFDPSASIHTPRTCACAASSITAAQRGNPRLSVTYPFPLLFMRRPGQSASCC